MSSLLRLPSLDRSSFGLTKRFTLLAVNGASSFQDDPNSSSVSLGTLPSVECLDNNDFLNMFESSDDGSGHMDNAERSTISNPRNMPAELPLTPTLSRFPELHGSPVRPFELDHSTKDFRMLQPPPSKSHRAKSSNIIYRSSVSSSNPSGSQSDTSSRRTRKSSMSSVTDDVSSSDQSVRESNKENTLHQRLKRRSREKCFGKHYLRLATDFAPIRVQKSSEVHPLGSLENAQDIIQPPGGMSLATSRPSSRGTRLGLAMADGLPVSPPTTPKASSFQTQRKLSPKSPLPNSSSRRTSGVSTATTRSSRLLAMKKTHGMDRVRVGIMSRLDDVNDLQSCAQISRDFYLTFQKYESVLVDHVLQQQSPAAWELRNSVRHLEKPSPFRLRSVQRDYATIHALEDFIVWRCQSVLRPQTLNALLGEDDARKSELEEAVWLIWTFCNVFGKTAPSDATLIKQTQWLNGVDAQPCRASSQAGLTRRACTMKQLEDISEMWRCLEMLLSGFMGRETEARQAGLFDNFKDSLKSDEELLSAWIHDILSLGPKAVLTLSSCDFEQAKVLGITRWTPPPKGRSRSKFLKAAVEEVYRERLVKEARQKAADYRRSMQHNHKRSPSDPSCREPHVLARPLSHQGAQRPLKLDTQHLDRRSMPLQELSPCQVQLDIRPDCDPLSPLVINQAPVLSPSTDPSIFSPLAMTKNASTKFGATLFPMQNRDQSNRRSIPVRPAMQERKESDCVSIADVIDPSDKAVALMVHDMGYSEAEVKRALALSDTGAGINVQRAIEFLSTDLTVTIQPRNVHLSELPAAVGDAKYAARPSNKEICEGHCKSVVLVEPRRERVSGLGMVKRGLSSGISFRKSARLSVIQDDDEPNSATSTHTLKVNATASRSSTILDLATSAMAAFANPASHQSTPLLTIEQRESLTALPEHSPVSPISLVAKEWPNLGTDHTPDVQPEPKSDESLPPKPRITLQRVGTGMKKQSWNIPGRKRKEHIIQPEIIGYTY